jgi:methylglutaconyl-CoA hydratase
MLDVSSGAVVRVTLNRPEVRNAFDDGLIAALTRTFETLHETARVVVISGEGKAFCAGGDLEWMRKAANYTEEQNYEDALRLAKLFRSIAYSHAVVIAKVHGAAFGGGCGLVAASDVAVAAEDTKFSFSEVKLGLLPGTISPYVIPKIGAGNARALFSTGEVFGAEKALRIGLVHDVAVADALDGIVNEKIKSVLASGPSAVTAAKQLVLDAPVSIEESARRLAQARAGAEGREGVAAFLEKRKASFVVEA